MSANYINEPGINNPSNANKRNTVLYSTLAVLALLLIILITYLIISKGSHYDAGMKFLQGKEYTRALTEFQSVSPDDKDFGKAQNKINYINGLMAFNNGRFDDAKVYLSKVEPSDEYYNEAKLMIDNITGNLKEEQLQALLDKVKNNKDTVIVKEKTGGTNAENNGTSNTKEKPPAKGTDEEISKKYVSQVEGLINKFQTSYQSAENASVDSKRNYVTNMSTILSQLNGLSYNANEKNAFIIDLKSTAAKWMSKRIEYINKLISEKSTGVTNTTRSAKEEGDKLFNMTKNQLSKTKGFYNI